jgi:hypothetical protein
MISKNTSVPSKNNQHGNVLFLILIAVALFAALSYAVTQSTRGGGDADVEKLQTNAAQIVQYAGSVGVAVQRIMVAGGYTFLDIDSVDSGLSSSDNAACTSDECSVFNANRNGVQYIPPQEEWIIADTGAGNWGEYRIVHFPVNGVGTTGGADQELVWVLPFIKEKLCMTINEKVGITSAGVAPPTALLGINLIGWYTGGTAGGNLLSDAGGLLDGHHTGCFEESGGGIYHFYHVLDVK